MLDAIERARIPHLNRPDGLHHVSASIGVAHVGEFASAGVADAMEAADLALYRAKSAGRNQAVLFRAEMRADRAPAAAEAARAASGLDMVLPAA